MRGELYIDGKDAYTDFGVWITEGGYDGLLPFPELVEPARNDWPDEDGIEPDLEKPTLKPRPVLTNGPVLCFWRLGGFRRRIAQQQVFCVCFLQIERNCLRISDE